MPAIPTTFERRWPTVIQAPIQVLNHIITVASTSGLHTKQVVTLSLADVREQFEIKRVLSDTQIQVGPIGQDIAKLSNPISFDGGTLTMSEQSRNPIDMPWVFRAVYEEEPAVALRTLLVNKFGQFYSADNPLPVQLSDGSITIGTVNANLEVQLSHLDDFPKPGDINDSVRIGSGTPDEYLLINPDGSINVNVIQSPSGPIPGISFYHNEVSLVPAGSETTILTFTAGVGGFRALKVSVSGENVAKVRVKINGSSAEVRRLYWTNDFTTDFVFENVTNGIKLNPGDILSVTVYHTRPQAGDFEATLYGM